LIQLRWLEVGAGIPALQERRKTWIGALLSFDCSAASGNQDTPAPGGGLASCRRTLPPTIDFQNSGITERA